MRKVICVFVLLCAISICAVSSGWGADPMQPMVAAGPIEWSAQRNAFRPELWTEYNGRPMFTNADLPDFIKNKETVFKGVEVATGATITKEALLKEDKSRFKVVTLTDPPYNAVAGRGTPSARHNTDAINQALKDVSAAGGGTVILPPGEFSFYTIVLQSNANIRLDTRTVIVGATPTATDNYMEPENNPYIGLQDYGHSYFANSLIYGLGVHDVMIYGEGLITGSYFNPITGYRYTTIHNSDVSIPTNGSVSRLAAQGYTNGSWIPTSTDIANIGRYGVTTPGGSSANGLGSTFQKTANKGIAIEDSQRIVLSGFDMLNIGHFAFISAGVDDCLIENIFIDSNRDGLDIDTIKNVTIRNVIINTFQDDALVIKASFGVKKMFSTENILIYNCAVSGYDAGSAMAGTFTSSRPSGSVSNPHGRLKIGTEGTTGFDRITIVNFLTIRCSGFALESVDGAPLTNFIGYNLRFDDSSGGPIFVTAGDRTRTPVTGKGTAPTYGVGPERPGNTIFVLPNSPEFDKYPIQRYFPSISVSNTGVGTPNINRNNFTDADGNIPASNDTPDPWYLWMWNGSGYAPDIARGSIASADRGRYYNAVGAANLAKIKNMYFGNVKATNQDPRLPIGIHGMVSSQIENVTLENIEMEFRGGYTLKDVVDQRSASVSGFAYAEYMVPPGASGSMSYSVGDGAPKIRYVSTGVWEDDPYNIREQATVAIYPEPSNYGLLPAYGLYARHVNGLKVANFKTTFLKDEGRPAIVLDNVQNGEFSGVNVQSAGVDAVLVNHNFKRQTGFEFYPNEPYIQTKVENVTGLSGLRVENVTLNTPERGTPRDTLFVNPTNPSWDGYSYAFQRPQYPLLVNRPHFSGEQFKDWTVNYGSIVEFDVEAINPNDRIAASGTTFPDRPTGNLNLSVENLPAGASFVNGKFSWTVNNSVAPGKYKVTFVADDGLLPAKRSINIVVAEDKISPVQQGALSDESGANAAIITSQTDSILSVTFPAGSGFSEGETASFWFYKMDGAPEVIADSVIKIVPEANQNGSITFTFSVDNVDGNGTALPGGKYSIVYKGNISGETGYTKALNIAGSETCPDGEGGCNSIVGAFLLLAGVIIGVVSKKK